VNGIHNIIRRNDMGIQAFGLVKYFTADRNIKRLERLPEIKSPVMDTVCPESKRANHPRSIIALKGLPKEVKNIPVIRRGTQAVPISDKTAASGCEPFPVEASVTRAAAGLSDLIAAGLASAVEAELDQKVDRMRKATRAATEALAAQPLTGKIRYSVRGALADNSEPYTADFGAAKTHAVGKAWNDNAAALAGIIKDCLAAGGKARGDGYGNSLAVLVNSDAFNLVITQILKQPAGALNLSVADNAVNFPGFTLRRLASTYYGCKAKQETPVIPGGKACAVALDAPHWLPCCAIDDIDAQPAPLPFFPKAVKIENPSAWELYGKSKPFPVPTVDAACWAGIQWRFLFSGAFSLVVGPGEFFYRHVMTSGALKQAIENLPSILSIKEAAGFFSVHRRSICRLIRRGELAGYKEDEGNWCITRFDLKRYCSKNCNL
jgi:excisionase family DNA binding protein